MVAVCDVQQAATVHFVQRSRLEERSVMWNQPFALAALIVLISLLACTGHAIVTHLLKTELERRKVKELKRYNDRQDAQDRERSALSKQRHPSSPGPMFSRVGTPSPSPFTAMRYPTYPAPPPAAHHAQVIRRPEDELVATVIDISSYQTEPM
jgi:hypothetical protein